LLQTIKEEKTMLYIIGYLATGLIVGMLARGFMVDEPHPGLGFTMIWGMVGAVLFGWVGRLMNWYQVGSFYGITAAALGAVAAIWISYSLFRRGRTHKLARQ
jgi:uncharacterized membrane protein YeaQ/YmgE (transglycosylase-associated protein family)